MNINEEDRKMVIDAVEEVLKDTITQPVTERAQAILDKLDEAHMLCEDATAANQLSNIELIRSDALTHAINRYSSHYDNDTIVETAKRFAAFIKDGE